MALNTLTTTNLLATMRSPAAATLISQLRPGLVTTDPASQATAERCRCLVDAVQGIDESARQAGVAACIQAPDAFAEQLRAAGITANCDGDAAGQQWYQTTAGMVGIAAGGVAVLGLLAWAVRR